MTARREQRLTRVAARYAARSAVSHLAVAVDHAPSGWSWRYGETERPYFIASITKLFTSTVVMQLVRDGRFGLDDPVAGILGEETVRGLVVHDGRDYGPQITIRQLLAHTSGVPDYYTRTDGTGVALAERLRQRDRSWTFEAFLDVARHLPSPFPPGHPGKAFSSDTNYQLLGRVVETVTDRSFAAVVRQRIIDPVQLTRTWHFTPATMDRYDAISPVRERDRPLRIPAALASSGPDGGIVATVDDQIRFLTALVGGEVLTPSELAVMAADWNRLPGFGPLSSGVGILRFHLPRWQTGFARLPPMIGYSGSFGTVLYHAPETGVTVAATVNQTHPQRLPYPLLARIPLIAGRGDGRS